MAAYRRPVTPSADRSREPAAPTPAADPDGFVVLVEPGDRIHFLDWGGDSGPPVVLVHGLSGSAFAWSAVARQLAPARRVVAMDLRGHGLSDSPTETGAYDLDVLGGDVIAVTEAIGGDGEVGFVLAG